MRILVVDDEKHSLLSLGESLKKYGVYDSCSFFGSMQEAIEEAKKTTFDYGLLDIEMPGGNGLSLAEELIEINPRIRIAFITAYNNYATEAFEVNAVDYLLKPVRADRFKKAMDRLLGDALRKGHELASDLPDMEAGAGDRKKHEMEVRFFGNFEVLVDGQPMRWKRTKSMEIFAYLLENQNTYLYKDSLCELMWPEMEPKKALINLQTAIYQLRRSLEEANVDKAKIEYARNSYRLVTEGIGMDTQRFKDCLLEAEADPTIRKRALERAIELYRGGYLAAEGWSWARNKEARYEQRYLFILEKLAKEFMAGGENTGALGCAERILQINPGNEEAGRIYICAAERAYGKEEATKRLKKLVLEDF